MSVNTGIVGGTYMARAKEGVRILHLPGSGFLINQRLSPRNDHLQELAGLAGK